MNLATRFPSVYWACACLSVNAKRSGGDDEDTEVVSNGTSDYGKITKAISKMQLQHIKVDLPDINLSAVDFKPVAKENKILFGLGGLKGVSTDYFKTIIAGRPYKNFKDFYDRIELPTTQMIALIKSGAFNKIEEGKNRRDILMDYFGYEMDKNPSYNKEKITMANFSKIANSSNIPDTLKPLCKLYYYKEYLEDNTKDSDKQNYVISEEVPIRFFVLNCKPLFDKDAKLAGEYKEVEGCYVISIKGFKKVYDKRMEELKTWLQTPEASKIYNDQVRSDYVQTLMDKYCQGSIASWEMDTVGYYSDKHELEGIVLPGYYGNKIVISRFNDMPEQMQKGVDYYIMGTIIDVNKNKKLVSLLTINEGVVDVKFNDTLFIQYNKKISEIDNKGKKVVLDDSWLAKGKCIIVNGARREGTFICKKTYMNKRFTVGLIESNGNKCEVKFSRKEN